MPSELVHRPCALRQIDPGAAACDALDRALGQFKLNTSVEADWSQVAAMLKARTAGIAEVTYTVEDGRGNTGTVKRTVTIVDKTKASPATAGTAVEDSGTIEPTRGPGEATDPVSPALSNATASQHSA